MVALLGLALALPAAPASGEQAAETAAARQGQRAQQLPESFDWTQDFSHGEMIRDGYDQTLTIDPRNLQFLYQCLDPDATGDYSQLPWHLGLATQTTPTC